MKIDDNCSGEKGELAVEDEEMVAVLITRGDEGVCGDGKCTNLTWYISFVVGFRAYFPF
jgi:hypothetical protein